MKKPFARKGWRERRVANARASSFRPVLSEGPGHSRGEAQAVHALVYRDFAASGQGGDAGSKNSGSALAAAGGRRGHQHGAGELAGDVGMHADADDLARIADQRAFDVVVVAAQLALGEGDVHG